jgi:hypothetical protein
VTLIIFEERPGRHFPATTVGLDALALGGRLGGEASGETSMRTSLQRWIVGCTAAFGTMMFVATAAILTPAKPDSSARIASGCPSKVKRAIAHGLDDA